ncbi:MAG: histidine--tRNA ligase, partial [Candidatus Eisenbacteria bacterium]|nr:histidine--tRNA ligase [Candidatus Eisenbacteria bacterium]
MAPIKPKTFRGTRDFLPEVMVPRSELIDTIRAKFEQYGFAPLETPAIEYLETLSGKYGDEGEKLLYRLAYK